MSIWVNLILWVCILPLIPIMYFMLRNECKPKKNIIVGVTLPYEAQRDPEVLKLLERYKKEMKRICWLSWLPVIPCLFIRSIGISMTLWILWIFAVAFAFYIPYVRCNTALRKLKNARGWKRKGNQKAVADLKAAAESIRWISPLWFLPPFLISLLPLIFDRTMWWLWTLDAVLIPVFYACYRWLYRNRAEVVDEDSGRTLTLTRIRRYNWGKCWLIMAWATGIFNVGMWLTLEHIWACMAVSLIYGTVVVVAVLGVEFRVRRLQEKLTADSGRSYYADEDDRWIWGMFYYNPNDSRLTVNARVGIGTTINLAKRSGQVIMALVAVFLVACVLCGPWLGWYLTQMEQSPVELTVTETAVVASHYHSEYTVLFDDIADIQLVEELPSISRVSGNAMKIAKTGSWRNSEWGGFTCCIDPRTGPWLLLETEDGKTYLFGSSTEGAIEAVVSALQSEE